MSIALLFRVWRFPLPSQEGGDIEILVHSDPLSVLRMVLSLQFLIDRSLEVSGDHRDLDPLFEILVHDRPEDEVTLGCGHPAN